MATPTFTKLKEAQYLLKLREVVDALKARLRYPRYAYANEQQARIVAYFLRRAVQFGEAASRVSDLPEALDVFLRIFCDDSIRLFWVAKSRDNAEEYAKIPLSEMVKMARLNMQKGHLRVVNTVTGEDATAEVLAEAPRFIAQSRKLDLIAQECGLGMVYDIPFKGTSPALHGNTFDMPEIEGAELVTLPGIIAFVRVAIVIADNFPEHVTSPEEVLRILWPSRKDRA